MTFMQKIERKEIYFTNHALDRWWERCEANNLHGRNQSLDLLRERLEGARLATEVPDWTKVNDYHRRSANSFLAMDEESGFVVKQNPNGDHVAVTFLDKLPDEE